MSDRPYQVELERPLVSHRRDGLVIAVVKPHALSLDGELGNLQSRRGFELPAGVGARPALGAGTDRYRNTLAASSFIDTHSEQGLGFRG
jgi:hypothetical protein